jgi:hypothetical protein
MTREQDPARPERDGALSDDPAEGAPTGDPFDAEGFQEDPDAAPTAEGRVEQAVGELKKLLRAALLATAGTGALVALWDAVRGHGSFPTTLGFLLGAGLATLNLRVLAGGYFAILRGEGASLRALLAFGGSFFGLVLVAFYVVMAHRDWTLGFALGLTTPALAGILYGRTLKDT